MRKFNIIPASVAVFLFYIMALPSYGARLEYFGGGFAITPYFHAFADSYMGVPIVPIIQETYNPGTFYASDSLSGNVRSSKELWDLIVLAEVGWSLQINYGSSFILKSRVDTTAFSSLGSGAATSSIRFDTQYESQPLDGFFLKLVPEAGEHIGQSATILWNYEIISSFELAAQGIKTPLNILESAASQPVFITVNGSPVWSTPSFTVPWQEIYSPPYYIEIGSKIGYQGYPWPSLQYVPPIDCRIGDIIGLHFGIYQESAGGRYTPDRKIISYTQISFSLTPQVSPVPLPGTFLLLGAGLGCLALYTHWREPNKN